MYSICFTGIDEGWAVGESGIILETMDGGITWISQTSGTLNPLSSVFFTDSSTGWAVGGNGTIIKTTNGGVSFVEEHLKEVITPAKFLLSQNYPNPFNPSTRICYSIPSQSKVTIKVFDVIGNEITILVNEEKQAGSYEVEWNPGDFPSGVYFYQLKAGEYINTKKMILLK